MALKPDIEVKFDPKRKVDQYLARIKSNGKYIPKVFPNVDETSAIKRAWAWYDRNPQYWDAGTIKAKAPALVAPERVKFSGIGHGKVWVFNRDTKHKTRIYPDKLPEYIGNGYFRGSSQSK